MKIKRHSVERDVSSSKNSLSEAKVIYKNMESEYHSELDCGLDDIDSSLAKTSNDAITGYLDSIKSATKILKDSGMDTVVSALISLSDVQVSSAQSQFSVLGWRMLWHFIRYLYPRFLGILWNVSSSSACLMKLSRLKWMTIIQNWYVCPHLSRVRPFAWW